jgi:hypothetical protein
MLWLFRVSVTVYLARWSLVKATDGRSLNRTVSALIHALVPLGSNRSPVHYKSSNSLVYYTNAKPHRQVTRFCLTTSTCSLTVLSRIRSVKR